MLAKDRCGSPSCPQKAEREACDGASNLTQAQWMEYIEKDRLPNSESKVKEMIRKVRYSSSSLPYDHRVCQAMRRTRSKVDKRSAPRPQQQRYLFPHTRRLTLLLFASHTGCATNVPHVGVDEYVYCRQEKGQH